MYKIIQVLELYEVKNRLNNIPDTHSWVSFLVIKMKTQAKEECKSCEFDYKVNSSIGVCNALDCKGTRELMQKINDKRKKKAR